MSKLHEILAVEGDAQNTFKKLLEETSTTFDKKNEHFIETHIKLEHFNEDDKNSDQETSKAMVDTVPGKLDYLKDSVTRFLDVLVQKESTNQIAKADIVVDDGTVLAKEVPVTALLALERHLKELREVYSKIPTLAPGRFWEKDEQRVHAYRDREPNVKFRTRKTMRPVILVPPTDKHPAQVEKIMEDVNIGKITERQWSGMVSPLDKSRLLGRIDDVIRAVKQARMRANSVEVVKAKLGDSFFKYIHQDVVA